MLRNTTHRILTRNQWRLIHSCTEAESSPRLT